MKEPEEDQLSPAKLLRDLASESPTERVGDGTPGGPLTSPPVELPGEEREEEPEEERQEDHEEERGEHP